MKYDALSAKQKDALIAQKIMEWQPTPCDEVELTVYDSGDACCSNCGAYDHISNFEHDEPKPPRYSKSMDAAWQVIQEMNKPIDGSYARYAAFCDAIERIIGSNLLFDILYCDALGCHLTADRICRAALHAIGVLDENGEVVEEQS